jgi:hypothetical protein
VGLLLALLAGAVARSAGLTTTTLLFWVGLVVAVTIVCSVLDGAWGAADPWATAERLYRLENVEPKQKRAPWWLGPLLLYGLFWFELVSQTGFDDFWVIVVLVAYSQFAFTYCSALGEGWSTVDPLSILFGFAGSVAPLRLSRDGLYYRAPVAVLSPGAAMPRALFASVFVLLGSTTLDNVRETVGWSNLRDVAGLGTLPEMLVDTCALAVFPVLFLVPFVGSIALARRWTGSVDSTPALARRFAWSLIPIGVAYLLAHNAALVMTGVPALLRSLSDPFALGWNLFGTANLFEGYLASPQLVWFLEIALIVGGHVMAVLAAHRVALSVSAFWRPAIRSQYALTGLMAVYTIATLWLLAQPLVVGPA